VRACHTNDFSHGPILRQGLVDELDPVPHRRRAGRLQVRKTADVGGGDDLRRLLVDQQGWTMLTAVNLMLFSLLHNPCATTILTIYKETLSARWTALGALMPLAVAFLVTFLTATIARLLGWV